MIVLGTRQVNEMRKWRNSSKQHARRGGWIIETPDERYIPTTARRCLIIFLLQRNTINSNVRSDQGRTAVASLSLSRSGSSCGFRLGFACLPGFALALSRPSKSTLGAYFFLRTILFPTPTTVEILQHQRKDGENRRCFMNRERIA
jgi:hypothetical protein